MTPPSVAVPVAVLRRYLSQRGTGHAHAVPGVWDWDNRDRAFRACQTCADFAMLRAALEGQRVLP